jgi:hypothetical protein
LSGTVLAVRFAYLWSAVTSHRFSRLRPVATFLD